MAVKKYEWRESSRLHADPQLVGQAIHSLGRRLGRDIQGLKPSDVVAEAVKNDSPLHSLFTWDDGEAARLYREEEARNILRSIYVVETTGGEEKRFIGRVAVRTEDSDGKRHYVPTSLAAARQATRDQMLADAVRGLKGWQERYRHLEGASKAVLLIDRAIDSIEASKTRRQKQIAATV